LLAKPPGLSESGFFILNMNMGTIKYAMGLLPVDCFKRSTRENYNLTTKLISLRNHRNICLPYLSMIKTLLLNALRRQNPVVLKACNVLLQVLLINYLYHNRGYIKTME